MTSKTKPPTEPTTETPSTMEVIRSRILAGESVSLPEYTAARSSEEFVEVVADLSGQRKAAAEAAELAGRQQAFSDSVLNDPLLAQGAAAAAATRLRDSVSEALTVFTDTVGQINAAANSAVRSAKGLGLVDDASAPAHYRGGVQAGLVVNGDRVTVSASWHRTAERALANALAQARREHR